MHFSCGIVRPPYEAHGRFQVLGIVLKATYTNVPHVNICSDPDAPNRHKGIQLYGGFQIELMSYVLKYRQKILAIRSFGGSGKAKGKLRMEV